MRRATVGRERRGAYNRSRYRQRHYALILSLLGRFARDRETLEELEERVMLLEYYYRKHQELDAYG